MSWGRVRSPLLVLVVALAGGCDSLVGAECADEFSICSDSCVDLQSDSQNCGDCGVVCFGVCIAGECAAAIDSQGDTDAEPRFDAASGIDAPPVFDAGPVFDAPPTPDAPPPSDAGPLCDAGLSCGGMCVDTDTDNDHCGACNSPCTFPYACSGGGCLSTCTAPTPDVCNATCVDKDSDPDNCGSCNNVCASGLCSGGICLGATTGHVVIIGHDYVESRVGMNRLVGNAVFLPSGSPVQVLVYEGDAIAGAINGTDAAIDQVAAETGRTWQRTVAAMAEVPTMLPSYDVFVIYNQENGNDSGLQALGSAWQVELITFLATGGVIVVLEGAGTHNGTYQILQQAGLFTANSRTIVSGDTMTVISPGDAIATGVPLIYAGEITTVRFDTTDTIQVVRDGPDPIVIHKLF